EALNVLRIEKGHAGGPEVNGQTTAGDLGLGGMMSKDKDFVGKGLSGRPALTSPARQGLGGGETAAPAPRSTPGSQFTPLHVPAKVETDLGHLTSVAWSPSLGQDVGIGFMSGGRERIGSRVRAVDLLRGNDVVCDVVSPVFVDPEGVRTHG